LSDQPIGGTQNPEMAQLQCRQRSITANGLLNLESVVDSALFFRLSTAQPTGWFEKGGSGPWLPPQPDPEVHQSWFLLPFRFVVLLDWVVKRTEMHRCYSAACGLAAETQMY
jgi:hypothetical protein